MVWVDWFFSNPVAFGISGLLLVVVSLLLASSRTQRWLLCISLFLYARYLVWRLLYTIPTEDWSGMLVGSIVFLAELYGFVQFIFLTYQSWAYAEQSPVPLSVYEGAPPTVDIMVTVVDEPLDILTQTLVGCRSQDYPKDRYQVHVLDDGHRDEVKQLAESFGCGYLRRADRPRHAKAGNLNHALGVTHGELIAVFDVDHVPTRDFLKDTVGFFHDPQVAIVQTPHHFYNPDIFQRNLRVGEQVRNDQELFFRCLQVGRDAHNSAFFAGSCGLLRRKPLQEIGGFQTETLTEDIHTSLVLHSKGYTSRYLNRVLSAGLMPETFEGYLKQRTRWTIGAVQVFRYDNPVTKPGLTMPQRLDYLGALNYFFLGAPRVICLVAPLAALLFQVPVMRANVASLTAHFLSFFVALVLMTRSVTRGTRNPLWSDIYDLAVCFPLSVAALKTLVGPRTERKFEVTPKGEQVKKNTTTALSSIWPMLVTFGLLIMGLGFGLWRWWHGTNEPGLPISLAWGAVNLLFLTIALFVVCEQSQSRSRFRLHRNYTGELAVGEDTIAVQITNISEGGAALILPRPIHAVQESVTLFFPSARGVRLPLRGQVVRQTPLPNGTIDVGLEFIPLGPAVRQALIETMFGDATAWQVGQNAQPGIVNSLWSLGYALVAPWRKNHTNYRRAIRLPNRSSCCLKTVTDTGIGRLIDISTTGVCAEFGRVPLDLQTGSLLELPDATLRVSPLSLERRWRKTRIRFRIEGVETGEARWLENHASEWQQRRSGLKEAA